MATDEATLNAVFAFCGEMTTASHVDDDAVSATCVSHLRWHVFENLIWIRT
jgi:hypothetical protein